MSSPWPEPLFVIMQHERQRQQDSQRQLYALNDGWPFGDGPLQWNCHHEVREGTIQMICELCPQAIFTFGVLGRGFTWNLELLKSRIADHVLKVHPEAAT